MALTGRHPPLKTSLKSLSVAIAHSSNPKKHNSRHREREMLHSSNIMLCNNSAHMFLRVRATSWDTVHRPWYNPNAPRNPKKKTNTSQSLSDILPPPAAALASSSTATQTIQHVSDLLKRNPTNLASVSASAAQDDLYMGYDCWLPSPPKVQKPRSVFNAASLAYIGDCVYELYARRHFLFPPMNMEEYNDRVMAVVRCEAQDALLLKLVNENCLSGEERDVLRWGKNISSGKTRTKRRAGSAVYNRASSLETLIGYLYLTNKERLEEIMLKLGFSSGSSAQLILEEANCAQGV